MFQKISFSIATNKIVYTTIDQDMVPLRSTFTDCRLLRFCWTRQNGHYGALCRCWVWMDSPNQRFFLPPIHAWNNSQQSICSSLNRLLVDEKWRFLLSRETVQKQVWFGQPPQTLTSVIFLSFSINNYATTAYSYLYDINPIRTSRSFSFLIWNRAKTFQI